MENLSKFKKAYLDIIKESKCCNGFYEQADAVDMIDGILMTTINDYLSALSLDELKELTELLNGAKSEAVKNFASVVEQITIHKEDEAKAEAKSKSDSNSSDEWIKKIVEDMHNPKYDGYEKGQDVLDAFEYNVMRMKNKGLYVVDAKIVTGEYDLDIIAKFSNGIIRKYWYNWDDEEVHYDTLDEF